MYFSGSSGITFPTSITDSGSRLLVKNTFSLASPRSYIRTNGRDAGASNIPLAANFWKGQTDKSLKKKISDGHERAGFDLVDFAPRLAKADEGTAKATIRELRNKQSLKKFINCASLNKLFPGGISMKSTYHLSVKSLSKLPFGSKSGYLKNENLDFDKDKIACEM